MNIEYKVSGGAGGYVVLMDTSLGHTIEPWEPSYAAQGQFEQLVRNIASGASVYTNALGNIRCSLPLHAMNIVYSDLKSALAASRTVPAAFLNSILVLKVTEGSEVQYFPGAVATAVKANVQGCSVTYNMDLTAKMVTATEPS